MSKPRSGTTGPITALLTRLQRGDKEAEQKLIAAVYPELRRIAAARLRGERRDHSLQSSDLVNEAYIKMAGLTELEWRSRSHFFCVAARLMRQILTDHARARHAQKRGGSIRVETLDEALAIDRDGIVDILAIDEALDQLGRRDARVAKVVECRFFGGLSIEETAEVIGVAPRTVKRDWQFGRAWLRRRLSTSRSPADS